MVSNSLIRHVCAALAGLVLAAGCSDDPVDTADPDEKVGDIESTPVAATELVTGDCLVGIVIGRREQIQIESASTVDCSGRHDLEVFKVFELTPEMVRSDDMTSYPGRGRVSSAASVGCNEALASIGIDTELLGAIALWPSATSWADGDRKVACALYLQSGRRFDGRQLELQPAEDS